jgi:hypothetical protein
MAVLQKWIFLIYCFDEKGKTTKAADESTEVVEARVIAGQPTS